GAGLLLLGRGVVGADLVARMADDLLTGRIPRLLGRDIVVDDLVPRLGPRRRFFGPGGGVLRAVGAVPVGAADAAGDRHLRGRDGRHRRVVRRLEGTQIAEESALVGGAEPAGVGVVAGAAVDLGSWG